MQAANIQHGCHRLRYNSDFAWTVDILPAFLGDIPYIIKSDVFSFHGHDVHLELNLSASGSFLELYAGPSSFPSSLKPDMNVRLETKNKRPLPFVPNYGSTPNSGLIWRYSIDETLAAYPNSSEQHAVTFIINDVDPPKSADKFTDTKLDWAKAPNFRNLWLNNDIPDGKLMNLDSLSSDFANLLKRDEASDVQLNCKGITRPAHRSVLAARSQVFSAMFQHKMSESTSGIVDIGDLDVEVLDLFLQYVYSGKLPIIPEDKIHELYAAADRYAVHCLKNLCSDWMVENLSADNCMVFLLTADIHSDAEFKNTLIESITDHSEWLGRAKWLEFSKENLVAVEVYQKYYDKNNKKDMGLMVGLAHDV